ncbi:MAG TPA: helix-turn-helix transcriptional regulator [Bacilli bacterium]
MLTRREQEVAALLLEGCNRSEIAEKLIMSENTVKVHVRNILLKYKVRNTKYLILLHNEAAKDNPLG